MTQILPLKSFSLAALVALMAGTGGAQADTYLLNQQDRIMLRVLRWNPTTDSYTQFDGVSGEYTIAPDGFLSVPLVGRVEAAGKSAAEMAETLSFGLNRTLGLSAPPEIGIDVIGHLPVYVLGVVGNPGAYAFRPGLTAQQALAVAGGLQRVPLAQATSNTDMIMRVGGEIRLLSNELAARMAERQRLLADLSTLTGGEDGPADADLNLPEGLEGEILTATQTARAAQAGSISDLQQVLVAQIERLTAQITLREDQIARTEEELQAVSSLKDRGLTVNTRVTALTSALNDLEAKRLELEIALLTARQQLNTSQRDEIALVDDARTEMLRQLNRVEQDISALQTRLATARALREQAVAAGIDLPTTEGETEITYWVTRAADGTPTRTQIEPTDRLQPGDTLEIDRVEIETGVSQ